MHSMYKNLYYKIENYIIEHTKNEQLFYRLEKYIGVYKKSFSFIIIYTIIFYKVSYYYLIKLIINDKIVYRKST